MSKLRFGIVGCGNVAQKHFAALQHLRDETEITAVCSINEKDLAKAASITSAKPYTDYDAMLKSGIDVVSICTNNNLHAPQGIAAAKAGIHVVTEKPMATTLADAQALVDSCTQHNVSLFVVQQLRMNDSCMAVKRAIEVGHFGKIYMVTANLFWQRPQTYFDEAKWRGTRTSDGGIFINQASHVVGLLEWFLGSDVTAAHTTLATLGRSIECEDTGIATLQWKSGAMASINVTMLTHPNNFETSLTILGEKGTVRLSGGALETIDHWQFADGHNQTITPSTYPQGHTRYYANVIESLRDSAKPLVGGIEGLKTQKLLEKIYAATNTPLSNR